MRTATSGSEIRVSRTAVEKFRGLIQCFFRDLLFFRRWGFRWANASALKGPPATVFAAPWKGEKAENPFQAVSP